MNSDDDDDDDGVRAGLAKCCYSLQTVNIRLVFDLCVNDNRKKRPTNHDDVVSKIRPCLCDNCYLMRSNDEHSYETNSLKCCLLLKPQWNWL